MLTPEEFKGIEWALDKIREEYPIISDPYTDEQRIKNIVNASVWGTCAKLFKEAEVEVDDFICELEKKHTEEQRDLKDMSQLDDKDLNEVAE